MPLLFAIRSYDYLKQEMLKDSRFTDGTIFVNHFPDGERFQRIETSVRDRDVVLVGGTITDTDALEMFDVACAMVKYGARSLSLVIPYYGYSTMERAKPLTREVVTAKTRARLLSAIPKAYMGNRVILFDLHVEGLVHYFDQDLMVIQAMGDSLVVETSRDVVKDLQSRGYKVDDSKMIIASTDAGGAKRVEQLGKILKWDTAFLSKRRIDGEHTQVTNINARVEGKHVFIYDDMTRSGSSIVNAAKAYKEHGAKTVSAFVSHGAYTNDWVTTYKMLTKGEVDYLYSTDSHVRAKELFDIQDSVKPKGVDGILRIKSCASILAEAVIHHLPRGWGQGCDNH